MAYLGRLGEYFLKNCTLISQVSVIINKGFQQGIFLHYWNISKSATFQNLSDFLSKSISHVKQVRLEVSWKWASSTYVARQICKIVATKEKGW